MTLLSAIILQAHRESNLVAAGAALTAAQAEEGLDRLSSLIAGVYGYDAGERLLDWPVGQINAREPVNGWDSAEWSYPIQNSRLVLDHDAGQVLYLPATPDDGARIQVIDAFSKLATYNVVLEGNGRLIDGASSVKLSTDAANITWMYRSDLAEWQQITALTAASPMPFPAEFDDYFIIMLAARINPRFGRSLNELSMLRLRDQAEMMSARYRQTRPVGGPTALQNLNTPRTTFRAGGRSGRFGFMQ